MGIFSRRRLLLRCSPGCAIAVDLATDHRAERFGDAFLTRHIHIIASDTLRRRSPISLARTAGKLGLGVLQALRLMVRIRPAAVVGFGGYPTIPPVAAAALRSIPTVIHEQNAVMGRANRLLAPRVSAIATSFAGVVESEPELSAKVTLTGNPVRATVIAAATTPYAAQDATHSLALLVFGGSQGARIMADIVPAAIQRLIGNCSGGWSLPSRHAKKNVARVRQFVCRYIRQRRSLCFLRRPSRQDGSRPSCRCPFRVSTVAELTAIGRPAILVPLPHALDQDQSANAGVLASAGGGVRLEQNDFTPERLAEKSLRLPALRKSS